MPQLRTRRRVQLNDRSGSIRKNPPQLSQSHPKILPLKRIEHGHPSSASLPQRSKDRRILPMSELPLWRQQDLLDVRLRPMERRRSPSRILPRPGVQESPRKRRQPVTLDPANPETANRPRKRLPCKRRPFKTSNQSHLPPPHLQQHPAFTPEDPHTQKV